MDRHDGTNARGLESAEIEAMRTQRDRAEEKARRLEAEIVEWKDAAMFVCAPVVYGGHLRPSEVREEVASLRRHLAVKREQYESRARVCDELRAELEAVRRERDEWKAKHDTLADVSRSCIATAERERDEHRAELRRLALLGLERDERMNEALSGEADAVRRAESAELGCEIAYQREPTQAEGDAHDDDTGECFVAMGGWTGRRCRVCNRWTWGGPTACVPCVARLEHDERAERIGRAVLSLEGDETPRDLRSRAKQAERFGYDSYGGLLRAIADAMEEP